MRLDNSRGFFSPEQKSCRILIRLASLFCINEDRCREGRQGSEAVLGVGERERSFPGLTCRAFPGGCDQIPAQCPALGLDAAGCGWQGASRLSLPWRPVPAHRCTAARQNRAYGLPLRFPPSHGCSSSASALSGNLGLRQGQCAHVL